MFFRKSGSADLTTPLLPSKKQSAKEKAKEKAKENINSCIKQNQNIGKDLWRGGDWKKKFEKLLNSVEGEKTKLFITQFHKPPSSVPGYDPTDKDLACLMVKREADGKFTIKECNLKLEYEEDGTWKLKDGAPPSIVIPARTEFVSPHDCANVFNMLL